MIQKHNQESLKQTLQENAEVVVRFSADWCGPCKAFAPAFNEVAASDTQATYVDIDADSNPDLTAEYGVRGLPSVLFFIHGQVVGRVAGAMTADKFREVVTKQFNR